MKVTAKMAEGFAFWAWHRLKWSFTPCDGAPKIQCRLDWARGIR